MEEANARRRFRDADARAEEARRIETFYDEVYRPAEERYEADLAAASARHPRVR
jgi:hypothetical protein